MYNCLGNNYKVILTNEGFTLHDFKMLRLKIVVKGY